MKIRSMMKRARRAFDAFADSSRSDSEFDEAVNDLREANLGGTVERLRRDNAATGSLFRRGPTEHGIPHPVFKGATIEQEYVQQFATEDELTALRRRCDEYFKIIETIEKERNQWIEMWRLQSTEHLTAQAMLERDLAATRQTAARAIMMLNKQLKAAGKEPIDKPAGLSPYDGEPIGLAESYAARMLSLREKLGAPIDGKKVRDAVDDTFLTAYGEGTPSSEATAPAADEPSVSAANG